MAGLADRLNRSDGAMGVTAATAGALREINQGIPDSPDVAQFRHLVNEELKRIIGQKLYSGEIDKATLEDNVFRAITSVIEQSVLPLTTADRAALLQEIVDDILGNGPLEPLIRDPEVTEIMVSGFNKIWIERFGRLEPTNLSFQNEEHLRKTIERIVGKVGRRIDESSPMVDARLRDGSRVNAVISPIALDGASLTIRKFFKEPFTAHDMVATATITQNALNFIQACVVGRLNLVISGGTGSGKTTTLNVLSSFLPAEERIITIEDSAELQLGKPHVIRLETRPPNIEGMGNITVRDLVKNALRMRPDRIVVGEVRDGAAIDMLQAMNTGHDGSLTTVHANSPQDALSRLETMGLMAGMELPVSVIRDQIARAINIVIQEARLRDGSRRITAISEIIGTEDGEIVLQDLFAFRYSSSLVNGELGVLLPTGNLPKNTQRLADAGVIVDESWFR
jgi:pilus assembly protein CpaF